MLLDWCGGDKFTEPPESDYKQAHSVLWNAKIGCVKNKGILDLVASLEELFNGGLKLFTAINISKSRDILDYESLWLECCN